MKGERWILKIEKEKFLALGRPDLAERVKQVSEISDKYGYDILSYSAQNENEIYIEVKTTKMNYDEPFYLTRNEYNTALLNRDKYFIYRVYNFNIENSRKIVKLTVNDLEKLNLEPIIYCTKI